LVDLLLGMAILLVPCIDTHRFWSGNENSTNLSARTLELGLGKKRI